MARRSPTLDVEAILAGLEPPAPPDDGATSAMLDATSALLAAYGMRRWSIEDVAERAGLGRATVYRRFESRDDLVHAALARDARRFFGAVADAVAHVGPIEEKVVEGFIVGLRLARQSLLPGLLVSDSATALSVLSAAPVLALARDALVERYQALTGEILDGRASADAELIAEALVRLGLSFVLIPSSTIDLDDDEAARRALRRVVAPLLRG